MIAVVLLFASSSMFEVDSVCYLLQGDETKVQARLFGLLDTFNLSAEFRIPRTAFLSYLIK